MHVSLISSISACLLNVSASRLLTPSGFGCKSEDSKGSLSPKKVCFVPKYPDRLHNRNSDGIHNTIAMGTVLLERRDRLWGSKPGRNW